MTENEPAVAKACTAALERFTTAAYTIPSQTGKVFASEQCSFFQAIAVLLIALDDCVGCFTVLGHVHNTICLLGTGLGCDINLTVTT